MPNSYYLFLRPPKIFGVQYWLNVETRLQSNSTSIGQLKDSSTVLPSLYRRVWTAVDIDVRNTKQFELASETVNKRTMISSYYAILCLFAERFMLQWSYLCRRFYCLYACSGCHHSFETPLAINCYAMSVLNNLFIKTKMRLRLKSGDASRTYTLSGAVFIEVWILPDYYFAGNI